MASAAKGAACESENESNYLSESSESKDSNFLLNNDDVEPIANKQEADYREELAREEEEEQMLTRRYSGEVDIETFGLIEQN